MSKTIRTMAVIAVMAVFAGACSDDNEVGSDITIPEGGTAPCLAVGCESTTAPPTTAAPDETTPETAAPTTTANTAPPTTAAQAPSLTITINGDGSGKSQFDPRVGRVRKGSLVRFTNTDSAPRSVQADNGAFGSPLIPPGQSWDFRPAAAGNFNYTDGTRPYAVGTLQVV